MKKNVYVCNVSPNGTGQEPLGLPTWNFENPASTRPRQSLSSAGAGNDNPNGQRPQNEAQEPLGLPSTLEKE